MMKRGKDADKVAEPMFPRLSVNDAEKGGPRAPPRNKMALYEQLCTPSQRFNASRFPSSPGMKPNPNSITPPASSNQVSNYGKSLFPPLHVPPSMPTPQPERPENLSSRGMNLNSYPLVDLEQRQNNGDEDDYTVPIYSRSDMCHEHAPNRGNSGAAKSFNSPLYSNHPTKNMSSTRVNLEQNNSPVPNREGRENQACMHPKETMSTVSDSGKHSLRVRCREMVDRHIKPANESSPRGFCDLLTKDNNRQCDTNSSVQQKFTTRLAGEGAHNAGDIEAFSRDTSYGNVSRQRSILHSGVGDQPSVENIDNGDDVSETSMVDSMSGLEITPDDVVGIIGYKHFLKARKAIANQQRVFSVQLFELHRLIQVQRLIAGSPQLMIDDNAYVGSALKGPPPNKVLPLEYAIKPPLHNSKPKSHSEKPSRDAECTAENGVKANGRNGSKVPSYGPFSGDVPPAPNDPRTAPWYYPQPSGHQWLVPVMSPSEGLIYKPYPGPGFMGPAGGGFGPTGGVSDPAAPFAHGGFMNPPYGYSTPYFPPYAPHPQNPGIPPGQNYFPPFSMSSANPAHSSSAVEQMHPFTGPGVYRQPPQSTSGASNPNQLPNQSSCNLQKQSSGTASQARKARQPKDNNGLQASTASSPLERPQPRGGRGTAQQATAPSVERSNPLSLFPTNPPATSEPSSPPPPPSRPVTYLPKVIKVVPHNAISATESAARIFRSIQRERKQQDQDTV
uniref:Early flowering 3 n=1 Tax=Kalanchoe fedtschenkoi TaxID=63787 RepID=A0A7N0TMK5_KALFE